MTKREKVMRKNCETGFPNPNPRSFRSIHGIEFTDELIDQIVYRLYGLTPEEIKIVECGFAKNSK